MKTVGCGILVGLLGAAASIASAAVPLVSVTVADSSGRAAYKGITDGKGTFATGRLQPGSYVVQFNSRSAPEGSRYALVISAGTKKVVASSVEAEKFGAGGVAMKIDVAAGLTITGQVAEAGAQTSSRFRERNIQEMRQIMMAHQLEVAKIRSP